MGKKKIIYIMRTTHNTNNKGSVLVITIVVTAVLLGVGTTLASILEKEITRQFYGQQSQIAMNMANSALECILFNDFHRHAFQPLVTRRYNTVDCGELYQVRKGTDWSVMYTPASDEKGTNSAGTGSYQFVIIDSDQTNLTGVSKVPCAHITVEKKCANGTVVGTNVCTGGLIEASIEVKGYSSCSSGEKEIDRRLVRRFKVHY